jgi:hypothetical protein
MGKKYLFYCASNCRQPGILIGRTRFAGTAFGHIVNNIIINCEYYHQLCLKIDLLPVESSLEHNPYKKEVIMTLSKENYNKKTTQKGSLSGLSGSFLRQRMLEDMQLYRVAINRQHMI